MTFSDYWELRSAVAKLIPRQTRLRDVRKRVQQVREKGRKRGYKQYNLRLKHWVKQERLLDTQQVNSFVEISTRAQACPMPLNLDVWDGLICPFNCKYCFANAFRASLYTAFFDNAKTMGLRHCNPDYYKAELDKLMKLRGTDPAAQSSDIRRAIANQVPLRFGIRFEDFLKQEAEVGCSLDLLRYLAAAGYPVMINTKSDLVGEDAYVDALAANEGGAAVHITIITSDETLTKALEPGAPTFGARIQAAQALTQAGVRVVARIEPYLCFVTDERDDFRTYVEACRSAGIEHITLDTYSYSANNPGIRQSFYNVGIDFDRLFLLGCDSQGLGSILLDAYIQEFRREGFKCSTFDLGCVPGNDQACCCEVGDLFESKGAGFNWGCAVGAIRFITALKGSPARWSDFKAHVEQWGGFLSDALELAVHQLWNCEGNESYGVGWAAGIEPEGLDEDGMVWAYRPTKDFRRELLEDLL